MSADASGGAYSPRAGTLETDMFDLSVDFPGATDV